MVRNIFLLIVFIASTLNLRAQVNDSISCDTQFRHFNSVMNEKLIIMWDEAPSIQQSSKELIVSIRDSINKLGIQPFIVEIIVDSIGSPLCVRFLGGGLKADDKSALKQKLKKIRFNPAIQNNHKVKSIYILKFG